MGFKNIFYLPLIVLVFGYNSIEKQKKVSNKEDNRSITSCNSIGENDIKNQPNIIFILADDQRFNNINAIGNKEIITPNLDQLVNKGTAFTNAYIMGSMNGAVCSPSRAMLMTGRSLFHIDPSGKTIDSAHTTLPKALSSAGYSTFHTGKWHNGKSSFLRSFQSGSKIFLGGMHNHYTVPTYEYNDGILEKNPVFDKHSSSLFSEAAVNYINNYKSNDPFFMHVAFQAPHDPREMPEEFLDLYDTTQIKLPPNFMQQHPFNNGELDIRDEWLAGFPRSVAEIKSNIKAYYAMITHMDSKIGHIIEALKESGKYDNTIIVFAGDNGLALGQHGLMGKQNIYEHSIKVPLVFSGPGIPKNKRNNASVYLFDIYPTLMDMTNSETPKSVQGLSLKNLVDGTKKQIRDEMFFAYKNFQRALLKDSLKLIKYNVEGIEYTQLFNLNNDEFEVDNLIEDVCYANQIQQLEIDLQNAIHLYGDDAKLGTLNWSVPVIAAWKDLKSKEGLLKSKKMAKEERKLRGF